MNILVILGHPRTDSLCAALAAAYCDGARATGVNLRSIVLADLNFDPHVRCANMAEQLFEPDLVAAKEALQWANHIVFVYPTWWGSMPALLKAFLDRVLMPGFAFQWRADGSWEKLLIGKSAHLITTMDTPRFVYRWIYGQPGNNMMRRATLEFCGIEPARVTSFGVVHHSTPEQRQQWIARAHELGRSLPRGILSEAGWFWRKVGAWVRAIRLQFYPMTLMAYAVGALASESADAGRFWLGYLCVFLLEFMTVLVNESCDIATDQRNQNAGLFSGGSRVLVENRLTQKEVNVGLGVLGIAALVSSFALLATASGSMTGAALIFALAALLGVGYTAPPIRLVYRGLGEINVAFTHSVLVIAAGYVISGGNVASSFPWQAGLPLFFAILPAIVLSGIPDREADIQVGKRTLAVRFGSAGAISIAMVSIAVAMVLGILADGLSWAQGVYAWITPFIAIHGGRLLIRLGKLRTQDISGRIDSVMVSALSFIMWFVVVPLAHLVLF